MTFFNKGICSKHNCIPCGGVMPCLCPGGQVCPPLPPVPKGPRAATIPFSVSRYGAQLGTDEQGNPQIVYFSGFGPAAENDYPLYLQEGEWARGTITFRPEMSFGTAFIMPYNAILKNIYVLFSSKYSLILDSGTTIYPFVCLAVSNSINLVYTVLQDTITYTEPYIGGFDYPKHTLRRGSLTNLNISIPEGMLVAIVVGIKGVNVTSEQYSQFTISGGISLE